MRYLVEVIAKYTLEVESDDPQDAVNKACGMAWEYDADEIDGEIICPTSVQMNANTSHEKLGYAIARVLDQIIAASKQQKFKCIFNPPRYYPPTREHIDYYDEVKEHFKSLGYRFRPYGFSGGVWQDEEYICW